jgi:hypothetical protein
MRKSVLVVEPGEVLLRSEVGVGAVSLRHQK